MTTLGLSYLNYLEGQRSNLAREAETHRANLEQEDLNRQKESETERANRVNEARNQASLEEDIRSHQAQETQKKSELVRSTYNDWVNQMSKAGTTAGIAAAVTELKRVIGDDVATEIATQAAEGVSDFINWLNGNKDVSPDDVKETARTLIKSSLDTSTSLIQNVANGTLKKGPDNYIRGLGDVFDKALTADERAVDLLVDYIITPAAGFVPALFTGARQNLKRAITTWLSNRHTLNAYYYELPDGRKVYIKSAESAEANAKRYGTTWGRAESDNMWQHTARRGAELVK